MKSDKILYYKSGIDGAPRKNSPSPKFTNKLITDNPDEFKKLLKELYEQQRSTVTENYYRLVNDIKQMRALLKKGTPMNFDSFKRNIAQSEAMVFEGSTNNLSVFRALNISSEEASKGLPKYRFSYIDQERGFKVSRGRANIEGFSVFYGCSDFIGSIIEIIKTESDSKSISIPEFVYVGEWKVRKGRYNGNITFKFLDLDEKVHDNINFISTEELNAFNMYLKHINLCFKSSRAYDFSSKFAYKYLKGEPDPRFNKKNISEIIRYSSFVENGIYENFAIIPQCIDVKFYLNRVFKVRLPKISNKNEINKFLSVEPLEVGFLKSQSNEEIVDFYPINKLRLNS